MSTDRTRRTVAAEARDRRWAEAAAAEQAGWFRRRAARREAQRIRSGVTR